MLREAIEARFLATLRPMDLLVPYDEGGRLSELHEWPARWSARTPPRACACTPVFRLPPQRASSALP